METRELQRLVGERFQKTFGRTPLGERLDDILREAIAVSRHTDIAHLREKTGDLLASVLMLCHESGWDAADLVGETLEKVARREAQYRTLGRKLSVALYGGAYNPITLGHIEVARLVLNASRAFDEVWLTPSYQHLSGKELAPAEHRLEMCRIAARVDRRIKVFDYEVAHQLGGETYHFAKRLREDPAYDHVEFGFVIGQDNANVFDRRLNFEELERMMRFVVVTRAGYEADPGATWYLRPPHIYLVPEKPLMESASSDVRRWLKAGDPRAEQMMDKEVLDYIRRHGLYV